MQMPFLLFSNFKSARNARAPTQCLTKHKYKHVFGTLPLSLSLEAGLTHDCDDHCVCVYFLAAGFLAAGFLAAGFLAALGFFAAGFFAAGFFAAFGA